MTPLPDAAAELPLIEPLDVQHDTDPAEDHGPSRRIPHLGHAVLFFSLTVFFVFLCAAITLGLLTSLRHVSTETAANGFPSANLIAQAAGYALTLLASGWLFPRLWEKIISARDRMECIGPAAQLAAPAGTRHNAQRGSSVCGGQVHSCA